MKSYRVVKLRLKGPLHLGLGLDDYDDILPFLSSDAIKSALFANYLKLFPDATSSDFFDAFRLSSAFPFFDDEVFFPKPMGSRVWVGASGEEDIKNRKRAKGIQWLDKTLFEQCLHGQKVALDEGHITLSGQFAISNKEKSQKWADLKAYVEEESERVTLSRIPSEGDNSTPFYFARRYFHPQAGLFFLTDADKDFLTKVLVPALRLLADEGIGSDRSVGGGWFDFDPDRDISEVSISTPDQAGYSLTLGLYAPTKEEWGRMDLDRSAYAWIKRGGFISSVSNQSLMNLRKRSIYMFSEVSAIRHDGAALGGALHNLKPDSRPDLDAEMHDVWREGRPLFLNYQKFEE